MPVGVGFRQCEGPAVSLYMQGMFVCACMCLHVWRASVFLHTQGIQMEIVVC